MSEIGGLLTTSIFNPALLSKEDLVRGFLGREDLLQRLLDDMRRVRQGSPPQHQLVMGQRGLGKTTLLRRLAFAIEDDPQLSAVWLPLVFPEEQYNVKDLADFWLNCADALSDALDRTGREDAAKALDQKVENIPVNKQQRSQAALTLLIDEADRLQVGLVLLVDNLDIVLDRLDHNQEWEFRRVISEEHRLYFIGASSRALEAFYEHGRAFYDYFQVHDLKALNDKETFAVLERLAHDAGDLRVQRILKEKPARVRALRELTGGNPRTLMLLYRVLSQGPEGDVQRDLEQLLDLYTPLYKARFEEMAPQAQVVVDAMAMHWDPLTAGDLAEQLAPLSVNQVSAQLNRLENIGVIEKTPWFQNKKTGFQIAERFFNIWYLMRASRRVRRKLIWLAKFLEAWYERDELQAQARSYLGADPNAVGPERYAAMALAYAQTVQDRHLQRNLESAGLLAALDESIRGQFDFSDLPPELQNRKERMARLHELRSRASKLAVDGVSGEELWRLVGGSPHLSLEEKAKILDQLPTSDSAGIQALCSKFREAKREFEEIYKSPKEVGMLYEVLSNGRMTDVYDVADALAVATASGYKDFPFIAIASQIGFRWVSNEMAEEELKNAERALQLLVSESGYELSASMHWMILLMLRKELRARGSDRSLEAVEPFLKAIEQEADSSSRYFVLQGLRFLEFGTQMSKILERVFRLHLRYPEDRETKFVVAELMIRSGEWARAKTLLEELSTGAGESDQPDTRTFAAAVTAGHLDDVLALMERTGSSERWRPLYEALRAVQAKSALYLRTVAPEIRTVAEAILQEIAPEFKNEGAA
jgi:hypothetical protein